MFIDIGNYLDAFSETTVNHYNPNHHFSYAESINDAGSEKMYSFNVT